MRIRTLILLVVSTGIYVTTSAQQVKKVTRKGVPPQTAKKQPAASTYTISQFEGKWQEVARHNRTKKTSVGFTDTLFYNFQGTSVFTRNGVNMSLRGKASVEPVDQLLAAADVFDIRSLKNDQVILDDRDNYLHTLVRVKRFWYEDLPTKAIVLEKYTDPISITANALIGKWLVYRRAAGPGVTAGNEALIKLFNVTEVTNENTASGSVTWYQGEISEEIPATFNVEGMNIRIVTEKHTWNVNVYKATVTELVFGSEALMYYAKPSMTFIKPTR